MRRTHLALSACLFAASLAAPAALLAAEPAPPAPAGDSAPLAPALDPPSGDADADSAAAPSQPATTATVTSASTSKSKPRAKAAGNASVSVGDNFFSPKTVTVNEGDRVTWTNNGSAQHSATANDGSFDTGVFGSGQSRSKTFSKAGTFSYFCTVHGQSQSGTVRVASTGGGGGGGGGADASSGSEAAAVASPDAAGTDTSLPATGTQPGWLVVLGAALLLAGFVLRRHLRA